MKKLITSLIRIFSLVFLIVFTLNIGRVPGTNAFFIDKAEVAGNNFESGWWIPDVDINVDPEEGGGEYSEPPCVTLTADIHGETGGIIIFYSWDNDNLISDGEEYIGGCLYPEEGQHTIYAQAVNKNNSNWKSLIASRTFRVESEEEIEEGDVIINEVMWMGSDGKEKDQWVELKNVSGHDIHLQGLYLTYKSDAGNELELLEIKDNRIIKKGEYFLASYYTKSHSAIDVNPDNHELKYFDYDDFQIKLYSDKNKTVLIDTAGDGSGEPEKGDKDHFYSMERNNTPGDGTDWDNWHNCEDPAASVYWDDDRTELGTPGHDNLSENDPTEKKENDETPADISTDTSTGVGTEVGTQANTPADIEKETDEDEGKLQIE